MRAVELLTQGSEPGAMVWDLYAGIGETTALLAENGYRVESVERDRAAVELAELLGPDGPRRLSGTVEQHLRSLAVPSLVLTNPPRTGMSGEVVEALTQAGASRLCYVSCDPATLARDIVRLGDRFRLRTVECFDQFPQTAHMETVAILERV